MPARDADRDGILADHGGDANGRPSTLGVKRHDHDGRPPGKHSRPAPSPAAAEVPGRMTRDVAAAAVVVTLVGWAFYATLGGTPSRDLARPVSRSEGHDQPPRNATEHSLNDMPARLGRLRRPSSAQAWELKRSLLHGRRASDYELDQIIPIGLGGAVLDRRNLQLQRLSVPVMHT
jgi:hypothetical protein